VTVEEEIIAEEKKTTPEQETVDNQASAATIDEQTHNSVNTVNSVNSVNSVNETRNNVEPTTESVIIKRDEEVLPQQKSVSLSFNDMDKVLNMSTNKEEHIEAPKTIDRLETISNLRNEERRREEEEEEDDVETLTINSDLDPNELDDAIESLDDELMKLSASVDDDLGIQMLA